MADRDIAVALPILSIHGNHDDPSGFNAVSPLDVLQSTGFINYFGRCSNVERIVMRPVTIVRGAVRIAIYGLGYIKDRIVYSAFASGSVEYERPDGDDWYNILVVHQNRVPRTKEYLPEDFLPAFFNLVVYGHEHESVLLRHRNFDVIQCGSTVRTSLCEAELHEKFVYILDIADSPRISRVALRTVRPFVMESMRIAACDAEAAIRQKLEDMLQRARSSHAPADAAPPSLIPRAAMAPLLRLRVEVHGGAGFNKHRLGQFLEEHVANPGDVIRISRKVERKAFQGDKELKRAVIGEIYGEFLKGADLGILVPAHVLDALTDYVGKDIRDAFTTLVRSSIDRIIEHIDTASVVLEDLPGLIRSARNSIYQSVAPAPDACSDQDEILGAEDALLQGCNSADSLSFHARTLDTSSVHLLPSDSARQPGSLSNATLEYTFLEDKKNEEEGIAVIKGLDVEPAAKKKKNNESDEDLFAFTKYI
ncbi:double-strand break repair protein MRE11 [Pancytospora philotis]|nr:double-strand break repair protein MRE11 [Pancytospora philotis]